MNRDTNLKNSALEIVESAGEMLKKYFYSGNFSMREKSHIDIATEADDKSDEFIKTKLAQKFPSHTLLTEETATGDFSEAKKAEHLWILDPIDGTVNFSRGNPYFAISLAYAIDQKVVLGIVYSPVLDLLYIVQANEVPTENGKPIHVSKTSATQKAVLLCDWAWGVKDREDITERLSKVCGNVRGIRSTECFVLANMQLARGEADLYMTIGQKPWDAAASSLIVQQAGGQISTMEGHAWNIFSSSFVASNSLLQKDFLNMLQ